VSEKTQEEGSPYGRRIDRLEFMPIGTFLVLGAGEIENAEDMDQINADRTMTLTVAGMPMMLHADLFVAQPSKDQYRGVAVCYLAVQFTLRNTDGTPAGTSDKKLGWSTKTGYVEMLAELLNHHLKLPIEPE